MDRSVGIHFSDVFPKSTATSRNCSGKLLCVPKIWWEGIFRKTTLYSEDLMIHSFQSNYTIGATVFTGDDCDARGTATSRNCSGKLLFWLFLFSEKELFQKTTLCSEYVLYWVSFCLQKFLMIVILHLQKNTLIWWITSGKQFLLNQKMLLN